jgi:glutamate racemase
VLGCTHYPFVLDTIRRLAGSERRVIDPAPAVAAHLARVLGDRGLATSADATARHRFWTTASAARFDAACQRLLGVAAACGELRWCMDLSGQGALRCSPHPPAQQSPPCST